MTTANPPTYFFILLNAVKVSHNCDKNPHCCSIYLSRSPLSACPLSPTDICTVWQSIISHHLQTACMGGSRDPYLYLIFILPQQQEWRSCQLKSSVNLPETHERRPPHLCVLRVACLMRRTISSYMLVSERVSKLHEINLRVWEAHPTEVSNLIIKNIHGAHKQMKNAWWRQVNKVWNDKKHNKSSRVSYYIHDFVMYYRRKAGSTLIFFPLNTGNPRWCSLWSTVLCQWVQTCNQAHKYSLSLYQHYPSSHSFLYADSSWPLIQLLSRFSHLIISLLAISSDQYTSLEE